MADTILEAAGSVSSHVTWAIELIERNLALASPLPSAVIRFRMRRKARKKAELTEDEAVAGPDREGQPFL